MTEALRQRAPANVLNRKEMERLKEAAIILGLPPRRGRQARNTASVCAQSSSSIFVDMRLRPLIRSESYQSCLIHRGNPKSSPAKIRPHGLAPQASVRFQSHAFGISRLKPSETRHHR